MPSTLRGMSSTHRTTTATSSAWNTLVQSRVARDAAEANSSVDATIRSSLTPRPYPRRLIAGGSLKCLRLDALVLEVPQRARVIRHVVLLVERRRRELAQHRLDRDQVRLVGVERL